MLFFSKLPNTCFCHQGHSDTVEDVVFQPGSSAELASVADDSSLLFWDTRSGIAPVLRMAEAHGQSDLHVVDWSSLRPELVATGMFGFPPSEPTFQRLAKELQDACCKQSPAIIMFL